MGFLNWFKNTPEQPEESQLNLLDSSVSTPVRRRVDGATIRKEFSREIQNKGGDGRTQADATVKMTQKVFGCNPEDLYHETGGRQGDRASLPVDAQTAYMVAETAATHDLKAKDIEGNKSERHQQIVKTVEESSDKVKGLFPWNW